MARNRTHDNGDASAPDEASWASRVWLSRGLRAITYLAPVAASALAIFFTARLIAQPRPFNSRMLWYAGLLAVGSVVSWSGHRIMQRLLPLALLLEMSLCFPESAPSRLRLARRSSSLTELKLLMLAPPNETAQEAAERMLKLLAALQAHDRHTRGHAERVRAYADLIAETMGMSPRDRDRLKWASLLHDIGKLHVPASLLNKPEKPDAAEWEILRAHPAAGDQIAAPLLDWLAPMHRVILEHHERWDGTGYPYGKVGREVSEGSRIVAVADAFEVMTAARAYKRPVRKEAALRELVRCAGTQFDPAVVRALVAVPNRWLLWAAGPTAWLAQVPLLGSNTATLLGAAANQIGTVAVSAAAGATIVVSAISPAATSSAPVPARQASVVRTDTAIISLPTPTPSSVSSGARHMTSGVPNTAYAVAAHPSVRPVVATPSPSTPAQSVESTTPAPAVPTPFPTAPPSAIGNAGGSGNAGGTGGNTKGAGNGGNGNGNGNGSAKGGGPAAPPTPVTSSPAQKGSKPPKK